MALGSYGERSDVCIREGSIQSLIPKPTLLAGDLGSRWMESIFKTGLEESISKFGDLIPARRQCIPMFGPYAEGISNTNPEFPKH